VNSAPGLKHSQFRKLDVDDFIILAMMGDDRTSAQIAKSLMLTCPAISYRIKKYEEVWEGFCAKQDYSKHRRVLSAKAVEVCSSAGRVLEALLGKAPGE